jgi:hypothetical protein
MQEQEFDSVTPGREAERSSSIATQCLTGRAKSLPELRLKQRRTRIYPALLELCQDLLLVLNDGVQSGLILQDGRLVFLDRFLISLNSALVCENRFLVLQNALLVCYDIVLRHFGVLSFPKKSSRDRIQRAVYREPRHFQLSA